MTKLKGHVCFVWNTGWMLERFIGRSWALLDETYQLVLFSQASKWVTSICCCCCCSRSCWRPAGTVRIVSNSHYRRMEVPFPLFTKWLPMSGYLPYKLLYIYHSFLGKHPFLMGTFNSFIYITYIIYIIQWTVD